MINELTPEQQKLLKVVCDEWINLFVSCPEIKDEKKLAEDIIWIYSLANLAAPRVEIVDSPYAAQVVANKAMGRAKFEYIGTGWRLNSWDHGWTAFYDFFERIGVDLKCEHWARWKNLVRSGIFSTIQLDELCVVSRMPKYIKREPLQGRLHSVDSPAVEFKDGFSTYAMWGVRFDKEMFEKITQRQMDAKKVLTIENMEQRMAALKFLGAENVVNAFKNKVIDEKDGYKLLQVEGMTPDTEFALQYSCPSTGREYISFVDPEVGRKKDALAAVAWKFSLDTVEWESIVAHS